MMPDENTQAEGAVVEDTLAAPAEQVAGDATVPAEADASEGALAEATDGEQANG